MLASQQVRIHSSQHCDFYLRVRSNPIIEHSSRLRFAPLSGAAQEEAEAGAMLSEQGEAESWRAVQDFGWLRTTPSPNW